MPSPCMPCPHLGHEESCNAFGAWLPSPRHDKVQVCRARAGDEGLGAIQHIIAASPPGSRLQGGGITATPRLCQAVGRQHAHVCQRGQPLLLLLPAPTPAGARRGGRGQMKQLCLNNRQAHAAWLGQLLDSLALQ